MLHKTQIPTHLIQINHHYWCFDHDVAAFIRVYSVEWSGGGVRVCRWWTAFLGIWSHAHLLRTWPTCALIEVLLLLNYVWTRSFKISFVNQSEKYPSFWNQSQSPTKLHTYTYWKNSCIMQCYVLLFMIHATIPTDTHCQWLGMGFLHFSLWMDSHMLFH